MTTKEAIELISETNEPLALVLQEILDNQEKIARSQSVVIEGLISYLMTPEDKPFTLDLSFLLRILKNN